MPSTLQPKYQAVLLDLDGTLLDTAPDFLTCTNKMLEQRGMAPIDGTQIRRLVSHGSAGIISSVFDITTDAETFEPLRQELLALYYNHLAVDTAPFAGITELLQGLAQTNTPWGIVTNKPERYTQAILEQMPFNPAPSTVICPDHVTHTKPDPEPVNMALEQLGISAHNAVYIGDHQRDIESGRRAGTTTIAAGYGYLDTDENPEDWQADHCVSHSEQLLSLIF